VKQKDPKGKGKRTPVRALKCRVEKFSFLPLFLLPQDQLQRANEELKALSVKMTQQIQEKDAEITRLTSEHWSHSRKLAALEQKLSMRQRSSTTDKRGKSFDEGGKDGKRSDTPDTPGLDLRTGLASSASSGSLSGNLSTHSGEHKDDEGVSSLHNNNNAKLGSNSGPPSPLHNTNTSILNDTNQSMISEADTTRNESVLASPEKQPDKNPFLEAIASPVVKQPSPILRPAQPRASQTLENSGSSNPVSSAAPGNPAKALLVPVKRARADSVDIHFDL
jgi:hypothetical protein